MVTRENIGKAVELYAMAGLTSGSSLFVNGCYFELSNDQEVREIQRTLLTNIIKKSESMGVDCGSN